MTQAEGSEGSGHTALGEELSGLEVEQVQGPKVGMMGLGIMAHHRCEGMNDSREGQGQRGVRSVGLLRCGKDFGCCVE